ncbi:MAG: PAS domain S-box protein [Oligoflexia bacterium]|nr:PAS domain S-box protein [Oligoflexia bacterium]
MSPPIPKDSDEHFGFRRWRAFAEALPIALLIGVFYWFFDAWIHSALTGRDFRALAFAPVPVDLTPRILVLLGALVVTVLNRVLRNERRRSLLMRFAVDHAGDAVLIVREDARILYANEAAAAHFGYPREELLEMGVTDLDPGYGTAVWPRHWRELRERRVMRLETFHRKRGGELRAVEVTARFLRFRDLELNCAFIRDISERKKAEQDLRKEEERVRSLLESTGEGIIGVDAGGLCTFVNPTALAILGYSKAEEMLGKDAHALVHHSRPDGSPLPRSECRALAALERKAGIHVDGDVFWRQDGRSFEVEYRLHPILREGKTVGGVYAFSDVSERKKSERELRETAAKLREANRLKDLFTDILRHDLMNPAAAVRSSAQLLSRIEDDPRKSKLVANILRSSDNLIELCENAARYARGAGPQALDFVERDLCALIERSIRDLEPQMREREVRIRFDRPATCGAELNPVIVDVFSNLISNAVKYGPKGGEIGIALEDEGEAWVVSVSDQGEGIPDEHKTRIFSRFERLEKQGVKGSGLGLAIAKQLVDLHSGAIWVEDGPGGGSIFRVRLPKRIPTPLRAAG